MSKARRIIFVNRFAYPDISATSQLLTGLVVALSEVREIAVVTSRMRYDDEAAKLLPQETLGSVQIHRVWSSRFGRSAMLGRLVDYLTFYVAAMWGAFRVCPAGSVLVSMTDPPLVSAGLAIVAFVRRAKLVIWTQDLFPDVAIRLGVGLRSHSRLSRALQSVGDMVIRKASANVAIGEKMKEFIVSRVPEAEVKVIHNWSPNDDIRPIDRGDNELAASWGLVDEFVVGYSGNLGRAHDIEPIIEAAGLLRHLKDLRLLIIGDGQQLAMVESRVLSMGLSNVVLKPYQPLEMLPFSLTVPDVHVVSLKPELEGLIVPSKFYGCAAAGRAVLFMGSRDGEIGRIVQEHPAIGLVVPPNARELAAAIVGLYKDRCKCAEYGQRARERYDNRFARKVAVQLWDQTLTLAQAGVRRK